MTSHKKNALRRSAGKEPGSQEINTLVALFSQKRYAEMEALAREMTARFPNHGMGWKALGTALLQQGRNEEALAPLQKAAKLSLKDAQPHNSLGNTLASLGRLSEAEASYRQALKLNPGFFEAHYNLGDTLLKLGRPTEAETSFRHALEIKPTFVETHINLGNTLHELGRLPEAEASYRRALELDPDYAGAHDNLGNILMELGRLSEAEASHRRALELKPDFAVAYNNLGNTLQEQGRLPEAEASYRRALDLKPDYAKAHNNLGNALRDIGQLDDAVACYHRALEIKPDYAEAHNNLGNALQDLGQLVGAVASHRLALEIKPDYAKAHSNLGLALQNLGQLDEAVSCYRRALEIKPDFVVAHSNMLFCLSHNESWEAKALFVEHVRFGEKFEAPLRSNWPQHTNSRNPERCLQIGFVSGDFYNHAVANFIESMLANLSGHSLLSLHAYANQSINDSTTQRLRGYFAHWHPIVGLSDVALAEKIRADSIDVLIDLSGHTAKNRLLTFARKPAPVQASWIGYPSTTGLGAMDYYLADRFLLPPGQFDAQFTEKIVYLPASAPFLPNKDAPSVNTLPALSNGYVTFCSFNRPSKLGPSVISLWSQLLRALPDSRMLLGSMPQDGNIGALIDLFAQEGIVRERLIFHPRCSMDTYLALHQQADICLDTFPYNGGTTTCHALWMGIPTLTLAGSILPARVGAALLCDVGLEAFVAYDAADFVQKGLAWACNLTSLAEVRDGLRKRFMQSPRGQPEMIASCVERALRIMWQRWCAGLPAESFEVSWQNTGNTMQEANT